MPFIVHSPYSGRPVKVRDQDISRALRDEEGRVFYAVAVTEGEGYYGSPTRNGSPKDEARAADMAIKSTQAKTSGHEQSAQQVHDATGSRRRSPVRWLVVLLLIILAVIAIAFVIPADISLFESLPDLPTTTSPNDRSPDPY